MIINLPRQPKQPQKRGRFFSAPFLDFSAFDRKSGRFNKKRSFTCHVISSCHIITYVIYCIVYQVRLYHIVSYHFISCHPTLLITTPSNPSIGHAAASRWSLWLSPHPELVDIPYQAWAGATRYFGWEMAANQTKQRPPPTEQHATHRDKHAHTHCGVTVTCGDISTSKSGPKLVCFVHFHSEMCFAPQQLPLFGHLNFQKWSEAGVFCRFFTSTCASRHNGMHFFDISTSQSGPKLVCFVHFNFEMCFAPQRRALFRHLNFQKWSDITTAAIVPSTNLSHVLGIPNGLKKSAVGPNLALGIHTPT